jgi:hypothetical protein
VAAVEVVPVFRLAVAEPVGAMLKFPAMIVAAIVFASVPERVRLPYVGVANTVCVPARLYSTVLAAFNDTVLKFVGKLLPVCPPVLFPNCIVAPEPTDSVPPEDERFAVKVERFNVPDDTARLPVIEVLTPRVTDAPLTVRLLNEVTDEAGSVYVPPVSSTLPVPGVHVLLLVAVNAPPTRSVPPLVMLMLLPLPLGPRLRVPVSSVDPLPNVRTPLRRLLFPPTMTAPVTVSEVFAFMLSVELTLPLVSPMVIAAIEFATEAVSVTVWLLTILTVSPSTASPG